MDPEENVDDELVLMTFPRAIEELTIGKRIQRTEWHDSEYAFLKDVIVEDGGQPQRMMCLRRNGNDFLWNVSIGDLIADDWVSF